MCPSIKLTKNKDKNWLKSSDISYDLVFQPQRGQKTYIYPAGRSGEVYMLLADMRKFIYFFVIYIKKKKTN